MFCQAWKSLCFHPSSIHVSHIRDMHNDMCFGAVIPLGMLDISSSIASACMLITNVELFPDCVSAPHLSDYLTAKCVEEDVWQLY